MNEQLKSINPELEPVSQAFLEELVTECNDLVENIKDDNVAYLRTPDTTISIQDYARESTDHCLRAEIVENKSINSVVGDIRIEVMHWLDEATVGYGPHELTTYIINYIGRNEIGIKRLYKVLDSNDDSRWALPPQSGGLPEYLEDDDPKIASLKRAFEGYPLENELSGSREVMLEEIFRAWGGDPNEEAIGLLGVNMKQARALELLISNAKPTIDPYFEYEH